MDVNTVIKRVQALLDDPRGKFFTREYIMPYLDQAYEDLNTALAAIDLEYEEQVITLSAVAASTADLSTYQAAAQPLEYMAVAKRIEWRLVGENALAWREVPRKDVLPDTMDTAGLVAWTQRGGGPTVYITPSTVAVDIRVTGDFLPIRLVSEDKMLIKGVTNVFSYMVAELISATRDGMQQQVLYFSGKAAVALENFESWMVKQDQAVVRKVGSSRPRRSGSSRWRTPVA